MDMSGSTASGQSYRRGIHKDLRLGCGRTLLIATLSLIWAGIATGQSESACLADGGAAAEDGRELPGVQRVEGTLSCMPADSAIGREVHERFAALAPNQAFETKGELAANGVPTADLYETLHEISTMQGIRYFSVLHRRERVLFKTAHAIDGPHATAAIPDPVASTNDTDVAYALIDDASFGRTPYRLEYHTADDAILLLVTNAVPLRLFISPIIDSERLLIALLITPGAGGEEPRSLYGVVAAQAPEIPFLQKLVEGSLRNRLAAMENWVRSRAASVAPPATAMSSESSHSGA